MTGTKARFPYFKFYPRDWLEATRSMSLEQRGAYIDLICILMEMEGHLRDDDRWISHQMHVSTRKWKAVKTDLIEHKKIRISDGLIIQERCLKELDSLLAQSRTRAESATNRERTKRENRENINEFNDASGTVAPLRARDSDSDSERKKESPPVVPLPGDAPKKRKSAVPETYSHDFEDFWNLYPRREGKAKAFESWRRLSASQRDRARAALNSQLGGLKARASDPRGNFCPHAATWINQGRFDDDLLSAPIRRPNDEQPARRQWRSQGEIDAAWLDNLSAELGV
jgi:uncharacterized protein YdaU (DUF1376 family)